MAAEMNHTFDTAVFLANAGLGRKIVQLAAQDHFYSQGDLADEVFYLQKGRAKLTVLSSVGKKATITSLTEGDFIGEESLAAVGGIRLASATASEACIALKISRMEMIRVMHEEHEFSEVFLKFLLTRGMRIQAELVDQLFNSCEKRLARVLLLMAEYSQPGEPERLIPKISYEVLAEMVGTTDSRVSFFLNRFQELGFIDCKDRIRVHESLLNVILLDQMPGDNAEKPYLSNIPCH